MNRKQINEATEIPIFSLATEIWVTKVHVLPVLALYLRNLPVCYLSQTSQSDFAYRWEQDMALWECCKLGEFRFSLLGPA